VLLNEFIKGLVKLVFFCSNVRFDDLIKFLLLVLLVNNFDSSFYKNTKTVYILKLIFKPS